MRPSALKRVALVCAALTLAATGYVREAEGQGTGGLAVPISVCEDASGTFVGLVAVDVVAGWLNAPHSVRVSVTSVNGAPGEPHGEGVFPLSGLDVNGLIEQGIAEVLIPWTLDTNPTTVDHVYTVCSSVIFADRHESDTICVDHLSFADCAGG